MEKYCFAPTNKRVNLSVLAKKIIQMDIKIFGILGIDNENGFINKIIELYINGSSIDSSPCSDYELNKNLTQIKGESKLFKLSKNNYKKMQDIIEMSCYKEYKSDSLFFKAIIESYCRLPVVRREEIFFGKMLYELNNHITNKHLLLIKTFKETLQIIPYKICNSQEGCFKYLVGFDEAGIVKSIRISHISYIKKCGTREILRLNNINKKVLNMIDNNIAEFGPNFIGEKPQEIQIKFKSIDAVNSYKYSVIHRPIHISCDESKLIYNFKCSLKQAKFFFFRFVNDIEVLKPIELRNWFKNQYKKGLSSYKK